MTATADVSVVVLSHNRLALLPEVLDAIERQTVTPREIILVDNPSPASDGIARLAAAHPRVRLERPAANLGFAGGMNYGMARASGAYTYLTEDDLLLAPDCLARLVAELERRPDAGMAAGVMRDRDTGTLLFAGGEARLERTFRLVLPGRGAADDPAASGAARDVTYVPTGSALVRTALLRRLGGFRAEFFMYMEDVELCIRVGKAGQKILVVPGAHVRHIPSASTAPADELPVHKWKNLMAVYLLHARPGALAAFGLRQIGGRLVSGSRTERRHLLRAIGWVMRHAPGLLGDRWSGRVERPLASS